jgi:multiple sugar transport system permease protein
MNSLPVSNPQTNTASARLSNGRSLSDTHFAVLIILPAMALFAVVILYPLVNSIWTGLLNKSLVLPGESFAGLKNLEVVLKDDFGQLLKNTLIYTVFSTTLPFLIGFGVALVLNANLRFQGFLRGMFLLPWLIPGVVVSFLWMWIFNASYGVLNGFLRSVGLIQANINFLGDPTMAMAAVILAKSWNSFPWMAVMLLAGLQMVPRELVEAAAIDGAGRLQTFWKVIIPHLRSIIGTVLLLEVIWNFQHFETIYVMTNGGPAKATTTFSIAVYETAFQAFDLGRAGAIGILWMVLLAGLVFIYLRFGVQDD